MTPKLLYTLKEFLALGLMTITERALRERCQRGTLTLKNGSPAFLKDTQSLKLQIKRSYVDELIRKAK